MEYISAKEAVEKWSISRRRVQAYCVGGRIAGAVKVRAVLLIPRDAKKPIDSRKNEGLKLEYEYQSWRKVFEQV